MSLGVKSATPLTLECLVLPAPRAIDSHKGSHGSLGVIGGADTMQGAALLSARAGLYLGAGRVYVGLLAARALVVDNQQPELMVRSAQDLLGNTQLDALVVGVGMGQSPQAVEVLARAFHMHTPLILDADALNLMACGALSKQGVTQRTVATIMTPHPAEAARLLGVDVAEVQANRQASALRLSQQLNTIVVLKGHGTVIAQGDKSWINPTGNPGMAAAGMGDVLTGLIGALIAQHLTPLEAAKTAVYLHGAAADTLVAQGVGPIGLTASEVSLAARQLLNTWMKQ
jgi:ADP-dependent NAD(P)H-hydrate dehydratase / NAD(P)H-hydrate epimerase